MQRRERDGGRYGWKQAGWARGGVAWPGPARVKRVRLAQAYRRSRPVVARRQLASGRRLVFAVGVSAVGMSAAMRPVVFAGKRKRYLARGPRSTTRKATQPRRYEQYTRPRAATSEVAS